MPQRISVSKQRVTVREKREQAQPVHVPDKPNDNRAEAKKTKRKTKRKPVRFLSNALNSSHTHHKQKNEAADAITTGAQNNVDEANIKPHGGTNETDTIAGRFDFSQAVPEALSSVSEPSAMGNALFGSREDDAEIQDYEVSAFEQPLDIGQCEFSGIPVEDHCNNHTGSAAPINKPTAIDKMNHAPEHNNTINTTYLKPADKVSSNFNKVHDSKQTKSQGSIDNVRVDQRRTSAPISAPETSISTRSGTVETGARPKTHLIGPTCRDFAVSSSIF